MKYCYSFQFDYFSKRVVTVGIFKYLQGNNQLFCFLLVCMSVLFSGNTIATTETDSIGKADYVVVKKTERKLYLYRGDKVLKTYRIALGQQPDGHKQRSGDSRTPEGVYTLDWRNPSSKFFRSMHISYPNNSDSLGARERGNSPGGGIMIHGQPSNWAEKARLLFNKYDWTEGCIAVQNHEMLEIWNAVEDGTPIEVIP